MNNFSGLLVTNSDKSNELKLAIKHAYEAGQKSRQGEIDELKKRIEKSLEMLEGRNGKVLLDDILDMLKRNQND